MARKRNPDSRLPALAAAAQPLSTLRVPPGAMVTQIPVRRGRDNRTGSRGQSVTAAAQVLTAKTIDRKIKAPPTEQWQTEAWDLRDEIGELRFIGDRQARACSQVRLYIAEAPDDPTADPVPTEDEIGLDLQAILFGNRAGTEQLIKRYAQQLIFNGESILHVTQDGSRLAVTARSRAELTGQPGRWILNDGVNDPHKVDDNELLIRSWTTHPQWYARADAPVRAVLQAARELRGLSQFVTAQVDSRLAGAGILLLPEGIESMMKPDDAPEDWDFADDLTAAIMTPITDRDSAASVVPYMATVPGDLLDKIKHLTFSTPLDEHAAELREETIRRIGLGMDSDPSVLLGQASSNHWSAWAVDENEIKFGVEPVVATLCHSLTEGLLHPLLEQRGLDPSRWMVWFDSTPLQVRPDRSKDAQLLYDKGVISAAVLRRENGFGDDDAPDAVEAKTTLIRELIATRSDLIDKWLPELGIVIPGITDNAERVDDTLAEDEAPPSAAEVVADVAEEAPDGPPVMGETEATE
ncbi:hypothetical protein C6V83_18135 [Gordonia iterans]|uniref:Portal protein n=1 Tax=Gordonia iterans TaxID=1004901 RepID=A0A2S0KJM9_9ACTN|nr:hypothetical protein [Gordonia iterans]AVM01898.1 hypothetical protein C6V83_18135 [Gordonia iterans]